MLSFKELLLATKGKSEFNSKDFKIKNVSIDTRSIKKGDVYIAIKGENFDGHQFILKAIKRGAAAVVVSEKFRKKLKVPKISVRDTTKALGKIALYHRLKFNIPIIAITGSAGKTTTKEYISNVLKSKYCVLRNYKTFNNHIGVPLTLLKLNAKHQICVIEFGTNQKGDIAWLSEITQPTMAVLLNIADAHLKGLKNKRGVFQEKIKILNGLRKGGSVFFNSDDQLLGAMTKKSGLKYVSFSMKNRSKCRANDVKIVKNRSISFKIGQKSYNISSICYHNVYNALAAICCAQELGLGYNNININIRRKVQGDHRFNLQKYGSLTVIDDSYNANPLSVNSALDAMRRLEVKGRKYFVFGDMLELGSSSRKLHKEVAQKALEINIDGVFTFGKESKTTHLDLNKTKILSHHFKNINDLNRLLTKTLKSGDCVLIKGSRSMKLERVSAYLRKKF